MKKKVTIIMKITGDEDRQTSELEKARLTGEFVVVAKCVALFSL